jgi:UDP-N-acetylglucosamine diphosphorylase / glucose-1-phosphate thymidylyltransferase / UDP-N-acetylgalactosamine diphosphorylase / glucosamine-1-phosphate N-acetyltransferase / galactosamine-1-phosphate N-acetyltransferase
MSGFVLVDDAVARGFEPFALTRPVGELRAGGALIRHRWTQVLGLPCTGFVGAEHLDAFEEFDAPPAATGVLEAGTVLVNARCAPALAARAAAERGLAAGSADAGVWRCDGRVAAVRLPVPLERAALRAAEGVEVEALFAEIAAAAGAGAAELDGWWLDAVWDLVGHLPDMLQADALAMMPATGHLVPATLTVIGTHAVHVDESATVEPMVIADATAGPVLIGRGAHVQAFTRLVGPCIIGEHVVVGGGRVAVCSIGERAKVHGELSVTIVIGHANKGHDGFVGHSVIGRWANLGAGTITSNLKNSYGGVALWTPDGVQDTGLQFLGSLLGDHVKTGIGTRLTTGCVVGAGANVFGTAMPPKVVAPFAWGEAPAWQTFAPDRFLVVAERVMRRRAVELSAGMRAQLSAAHARARSAAYLARWRG